MSITLYTAATPNGWKVSIALEEMGLPYEVRVIDFANERAEVRLVREDQSQRTHSGAARRWLRAVRIRRHPDLPGREDRQVPARDVQGRSRVMQWLMFQMSGVGPMMGQANVFLRYFPEKIQAAIDRYQREVTRLFGVLDRQLADPRIHRRRLFDRRHGAVALGLGLRMVGCQRREFAHLQRWLRGRRAARRAGRARRADQARPRGGDRGGEENRAEDAVMTAHDERVSAAGTCSSPAPPPASGLATAAMLARRGAKVFLIARSAAKLAKRQPMRSRAEGGTAAHGGGRRVGSRGAACRNHRQGRRHVRPDRGVVRQCRYRREVRAARRATTTRYSKRCIRTNLSSVFWAIKRVLARHDRAQARQHRGDRQPRQRARHGQQRRLRGLQARRAGPGARRRHRGRAAQRARQLRAARA